MVATLAFILLPRRLQLSSRGSWTRRHDEADRPPRDRSRSSAATLFWGFGFTWAKIGGAAVNAAMGLPDGAYVGPLFLLGWRFAVAAVLWAILFRDARTRWTTRGSLIRGVLLGTFLGDGLVLQHIGLDRTSEAVAAFLHGADDRLRPPADDVRRPPAPEPRGNGCGVVLATAGVWLMTGATPTGFGVGELLGLAAAVVFSGLHHLGQHDRPAREPRPDGAGAVRRAGADDDRRVPVRPGGAARRWRSSHALLACRRSCGSTWRCSSCARRSGRSGC